MQPEVPSSSLAAAMAAARDALRTTDPDPWAGSPNEWIRNLQTRTRGKAGELAIEAWLRGHGFDVAPSGTAGSDRLVNGLPAEIKLSTPWGGRSFRFSQIRDQDYRALILLGVEPDRLRVWCLPKQVAFTHSTGQHTGGSAAETRWMGFPIDRVPDWLAPYGGEEADGLAVIAAMFPRACSDVVTSGLGQCAARDSNPEPAG